MTSCIGRRRLLAPLLSSMSVNILKTAQSCVKSDKTWGLRMHQLYCTSSDRRAKGTGIQKQLPSAALTNPLLRADRFSQCQNNLKMRLKKQFSNINVNLLPEERGFYLRSDQHLFPMTRCRRFGDRVFQWMLERRKSGTELIEFDKNMQKASNSAYRQMQWLSWKHKLMGSGALSTNDVLLSLPTTAVQLCQCLRTNSFDRLISQGALTKEAAAAVQGRLSRLSSKQRSLLNLKKEDICYSDIADIEDSTRVYMMKERRVEGNFFLDFYVQCLMQYKKSQSCTAHYYSGRGQGLEISLPKEYGYSLPRPVYVILRLTQQLKPELRKDLVISAFNVIVCP
uniref:Uncharacterized protein n=1 Tax=Plectus sambesii TaxID=2011161 RepID=A0A914X329_9BILA